MSDDRRHLDDAERFQRYVDALLAGGRPSPDDVASADEAEMARLAAELAGALPEGEPTPDPAFVEQLRLRMRAADDGIEAVQMPPPVRGTPPGAVVPGASRRWRLSRRQVLQAGLGAAAGVAAGVVGSALVRPGPGEVQPVWPEGGLVAGEGFWEQVATLADLPPGSARRFSTHAFDGFVVNDGGEVRALLSACTHMGCTLHFRPDWEDLRCPCHGASFDLRGELANGPGAWDNGGYPGDARAYPRELPPLVRPRVKVDGDRILVWTAQV